MHSAFTLVELLVVIGIIALLISILLPALNRARQAAQRTACSAKLQQMMIAAQTHANDHRGYYPLAGILPDCVPSPAINDTYATNYSYFSFNNRQLASLPVSLSAEMGFKSMLSISDEPTYARMILDSRGYIRNFLCPSQSSESKEIEATGPGALFMLYQTINGAGSDSEPIGYAFNEAVLGYNDSLGRLRGHATSVRKPSVTMFACDAKHGAVGTRSETSNSAGFGFMTLWNNTAITPVTMADAYNNRTLYAGCSAGFDSVRHQGKINVAFCDGHVEARTVSSGDMQRIYLLAP